MKFTQNSDLPSLKTPVKPLDLAVLVAIALVFEQPVYADSALLLGDTYVVASGREASKSHGSKPVLLVKQAGADSYVKFTLNNASSSVAHATLKIFVNKLTTPGTLTAREEVATWDESTLSFTNMPIPGATIIPSLSVTTASKSQWLEFDVTSYVQNQVTAADNKIAFSLSGSNSLNLQLDSKESAATSHQPTLDIVWASAGATGPQGPQGPQGATGPQGTQGVPGPVAAMSFACVSTSVSSFTINANTTSFFNNPTCPAGYSATTPYCWTASSGVYSQGSGFNANVSSNATFCAWQNTTANSQTVFGGNVCCRVPAAP